MKKQEKLNWIVQYIKSNGWQDIFMEEFVASYISSCQPKKVEIMAWGADKVPELGRYLGELYKQGILDRFIVGLDYQCDGFPKWCYGYKIKSQ